MAIMLHLVVGVVSMSRFYFGDESRSSSSDEGGHGEAHALYHDPVDAEV